MSVLRIKDQNGQWVHIATIKGDKGDTGDTYTLTQQDKEDIAGLVDTPVDDVQINGASIVQDGVAEIPIASTNALGVIKVVGEAYGVYANDNGILYLAKATDSQVAAGSNNYKAIVPSTQHISTFYGLAKSAGDTSQIQSSNSVGTYTEEAKSSIQTMLGVPSEDEVVTDVQINGTSILADGVANIPVASGSDLGLVKINVGYGIGLNSANALAVSRAGDTSTKTGTEGYKPITPACQHRSAFYGLAKVAGHDEKDSTLPVGTYTEDAKTAIRTMLGVPSEDEVVTDVQINGTSIVADGVAEIPIASTSTLGAVTCAQDYGITVLSNGRLQTTSPSDAQLKSGSSNYRVITPTNQHKSVFYGLAKASGDTTQSASDNAVGTYTDDAKSSIQSMLGVPSEDDVVTDVQINGTSIINSGVANVPLASDSTLGVVKINGSYGLSILSNQVAGVLKAYDGDIKNGAAQYRPIVPSNQHQAAFYGLAKAAGDTTQTQSSNPVGQYTEEAKAAIRTMIGTAEQGPKGDPGYSPVRGTDYWTEADRTAIINDVLEALPAAEEVGF